MPPVYPPHSIPGINGRVSRGRHRGPRHRPTAEKTTDKENTERKKRRKGNKQNKRIMGLATVSLEHMMRLRKGSHATKMVQ
jgi:hypothetical protein